MIYVGYYYKILGEMLFTNIFLVKKEVIVKRSYTERVG